MALQPSSEARATAMEGASFMMRRGRVFARGYSLSVSRMGGDGQRMRGVRWGVVREGEKLGKWVLMRSSKKFKNLTTLKIDKNR